MLDEYVNVALKDYNSRLGELEDKYERLLNEMKNLKEKTETSNQPNESHPSNEVKNLKIKTETLNQTNESHLSNRKKENKIKPQNNKEKDISNNGNHSKDKNAIQPNKDVLRHNYKVNNHLKIKPKSSHSISNLKHDLSHDLNHDNSFTSLTKKSSKDQFFNKEKNIMKRKKEEMIHSKNEIYKAVKRRYTMQTSHADINLNRTTPKEYKNIFNKINYLKGNSNVKPSSKNGSENLTEKTQLTPKASSAMTS